MKAADKKIIKDNPGATLYELIQLGLSQEGIKEWEKDKSAPMYQEKLKPVPQPTQRHIEKPFLSEYKAPSSSLGTNVILHNKKTGQKKSMEKSAAERIARKYPNEFRIL